MSIHQKFTPTLGVHDLPSEPFRFQVDSWSVAGKTYLVDLEEYDWNGWCACPRFQMKCQPKLERGAAAAPRLRCKHIEAARDHFLRLTGPKLAQAYYGPNHEKTPIQHPPAGNAG